MSVVGDQDCAGLQASSSMNSVCISALCKEWFACQERFIRRINKIRTVIYEDKQMRKTQNPLDILFILEEKLLVN